MPSRSSGEGVKDFVTTGTKTLSIKRVTMRGGGVKNCPKLRDDTLAFSKLSLDSRQTFFANYRLNNVLNNV